MRDAPQPDEPPASAWDVAASPGDAGHFRPDIEGLRAVAILAVLLYHAGVPGVSGGFVGVDVFYVISGFLITGLLVREVTKSGRIDLPRFYGRRARRLLPAALFVIAITIVAGWLVLPSIDRASLATDGAFAALYVSNYWFALSATDYFAADGPVSPLLHYWSLGVEEQFYLFWPLVVLVTTRVLGVRRLLWTVAAIAIVSFALSIVVTQVEPPWAFFSLPTRAWQLAAGGLVALGQHRGGLRLARRPATLVGALGVGLILAAAFLIHDDATYPGLIAAAPTLGAVLVVIAGARADTVAARVLSTRVMRWLGRISYSLYLWHWPILILVPMVIATDLATRLVLALVAVAIAALSTEFIERPFRVGRMSRWSPSRTLALAGGASAGVAVISLFLAGTLLGRPAGPGSDSIALGADGRPYLPAPVVSGGLPPDLNPSLTAAKDDIAASLADGCQVAFLGTYPDPRPCLYGDPAGAVTVYLVGDSHAAQWLPALEAVAADRGWQIRPRTKGNCPPVDLIVWLARYSRPYVECDTWRENLFDEIAAVRPDLVFIAFSRDARPVDQAGEPHAIGDDPVAWRSAMERVLVRLRALAGSVVMLADTPRHAQDPVRCLATHPDVEACQARRDAVVDDAYAQLERQAAHNTGTGLISAVGWLCPDTGCPLIFGRFLVYRDTNHLTATFSSLLGPAIGWAVDHPT